MSPYDAFAQTKCMMIGFLAGRMTENFPLCTRREQDVGQRFQKVPRLDVLPKEMLVCDDPRGESDKRDENPPVVVYRGRTSQHVLRRQPTQTFRDLSPA